MTIFLRITNRVVMSSHVMYSTLVSLLCFHLPLTSSIQNHHSHGRRVIQDRPFVPVSMTGSMRFRRPRHPSEAPASWHPRPALTPLGGRCVAGHVVPGFISPNGRLIPNGTHFQSFNYPLRDLLVCPISTLHLAVGHFPKLETGMKPAQKLAG